MGNLVDYVVLIQLFDFTGCFSMRGIDQSRKDIRFQIVFQAAAVDSGINQCGTARIGQVDGQVVDPLLIADIVQCRSTDFVGYACGSDGNHQIFHRAASAQLFQGVTDIAFVVDERYGSLAGQRGECCIGCGGGRAV
ncbi:Uncharacterised protein [Neisseria meningitidis]|nr:Uncharacterised protein [Neisseria meningitidis]